MRRICRLAASTNADGQRANEIAGLRWDKVHDEQTLLPAERTKNSRPYEVMAVTQWRLTWHKKGFKKTRL
jgi:hypothetical protein